MGEKVYDGWFSISVKAGMEIKREKDLRKIDLYVKMFTHGPDFMEKKVSFLQTSEVVWDGETILYGDCLIDGRQYTFERTTPKHIKGGDFGTTIGFKRVE